MLRHHSFPLYPFFLIVALIAILVGCRSPTILPEPAATSFPSVVPTKTPRPTQLLESTTTEQTTATIEPETPTPTVEPTPTRKAPRVCSPLEGYELEELPGRVSNPYAPPRLGSDFHHQGVDLFHGYAEGGGAAPGLPVHAMLPGKLAMVLTDRFPYGNAMLVETNPEDIPPSIASALPTPDVGMPLLTISALTCPPVDVPEWEETSLYILYAHLEETASLNLGEDVSCGDTIGRIGKSGNAVNPHLHIEARWGSAGVQFESMGHYGIEMSDEERGAYCLWRVSGRFQHFDPLLLFQLP